MIMLKIGLTGNIGSGKSTVARIFRILGTPVFHADEEARKFYSDPEVKSLVVKKFGYGILDVHNEINRRSLASLVFTDPLKLATLNSIIHPLTRKAFIKWCGLQSYPFVIQEAAIIFETGITADYDRIIHVSCPKEMAIDRVVKRDAIDGHSVLRRMQHQWPDEEKCRLADFIIMNDGQSLVIPQVIGLHRRLSEISAESHDDIPSGTADA